MGLMPMAFMLGYGKSSVHGLIRNARGLGEGEIMNNLRDWTFVIPL